MLDKEPIARGTTADVYAWGDGLVLKLFHATQSRESVEYEARIGRTVAAAGVAGPRVFEVVEQGGSWGIIYERIIGAELSETIRPWNAKQRGRDIARLHMTLFAQRVPDLPRQRARLTTRVSTAPGFSEVERRHLLNQLYSLPDSDVLCHGDFHPANVIQTGQGLMIIDWNDATQGHPAADIARTILILEEVLASMDDIIREVIGDSKPPAWLKRLVERVLVYTLRRLLLGYREEIERLMPDIKGLIPRWMPVLAAARLHEGQYKDTPSSPEAAQTQQHLVTRMVNIAKQG
jgi:tRNA A-37 threonylcarbamoyl transferase component Bud32